MVADAVLKKWGISRRILDLFPVEAGSWLKVRRIGTQMEQMRKAEMNAKKESLWRGIEPRSPACGTLTGGYTSHYTSMTQLLGHAYLR